MEIPSERIDFKEKERSEKFNNWWKKQKGWEKVIIILGVIVLVIIFGNWIFGSSDNPSGNNSLNSQPSNLAVNPEQQCQNSGNIWCNNQCYDSCPINETFFCSPSGQSACINQNSSLKYDFITYTNQEPYYSAYCNKINPYNLDVRKASAEAIKNDPGSYNINQLIDIYDWVENNIEYQNVRLAGIPYPASDTLATKSGDCKNQAVLIASMVEAIGGTAKVVIDPFCGHAYALVYASNQSQDMQSIAEIINMHYNQQLSIQWITSGNENWLIFDPAGGSYPGNTLPQCSGKRTIYYVTGCMDCEQQYPNMPLTFQDKCYSECPSGTISVNNYSCSPCPAGSYSYKNQCVTCPDGYSLHNDGRCYSD